MSLFFLFDVHGVFPQSRAELLDLELFPAWLFANGVVVVACFLTNEVHDFQLSLAFTFFCHGSKTPMFCCHLSVEL